MARRGKRKPEVICPYCQKPAVLVDSATVYGGRSYGPIWLCRPCGAWVGCHRHSREHWPLGRLANAELRELKKAAHAAFDPLWQAAMLHRGWPKQRARQEAYRWLASTLDIEGRLCHIGMFNAEQCREVVLVCQQCRRKEPNAQAP